MGERRANTEDDLRFMLERLEDGTMEERVSAAWALGRSGRGDALPALLEAARNDDDVNVRINAIGAVAAVGGNEVRSDLLEFLDEDNEEVRSAALRALADERFADAAEEVGRILVEEESLRAAAADVLGNMKDPVAVPALRQVADDPDEEVRSRVAFALGRIGDRDAVPTLIGMLQDPHWTVRANAAQALGMIGDPGARAALEAARDDPNPQVAAAAQGALPRLR
jgi:HEAT repeat protein